MIWQHEIHRSRIILIYSSCQISVDAPEAPALSVNQLSRREGLKAYAIVPEVNPRTNAYNPVRYSYSPVNPDVDLFYYYPHGNLVTFEYNTEFLERIRHLVMDCGTWIGLICRIIGNGHMFFAFCGNLETITVLTKKLHRRNNPGNTMPIDIYSDSILHLCNDDAKTKKYFAYWQKDWDQAVANVRRLRRDDANFREKDKTWQPPTKFRLGYFS
jgi:hypothetical protein